MTGFKGSFRPNFTATSIAMYEAQNHPHTGKGHFVTESVVGTMKLSVVEVCILFGLLYPFLPVATYFIWAIEGRNFYWSGRFGQFPASCQSE